MNNAEKKLYALALRKEHYRRSFETYALEQLKIQTKLPGVIASLDITRKPLQVLIQAVINEQYRTQGYVRVDIVKGRQQGSSTHSQGLHFWQASTTRNFSTILIAQDDPTTSSIFEKARFFYEHLDPQTRPLIRRCVDEETECLTSKGWKGWRGVTEDDQVYSIDPQTGQGVWSRVRSVYTEQYRGELVRWETDDIDSLVTPEHKWLVTTYDRIERPFGLSPKGKGCEHGGHEPKLRYSVVPTLEVTPWDIIPKAAPCEQPDAPYADELLALWGWIVAEGHFVQNRPQVTISQSIRQNPQHVQAIAQLLAALGIPYTTQRKSHSDVRVFCINGDAGRRFRDMLPDKRFDWSAITALSARQAAIVLDALVDGDGHRRKDSVVYWTADPILAPQIQALAAIKGQSSHLMNCRIVQREHRVRALERYGDVRCIGLHKIPYTWGRSLLNSQRTEPYDGIIWCPETDTGTWLARRNGTTYFTHNSNKREIVFASPDHKNPAATDLGLNSRMDFQAATNINAGTGTTRQGYHLSELSKWKPDAIQTLVASIFPCLPDVPGTIGIEESTPFVGGNWFRERCEAARSGKTDRKFVFGPFYLEPDYVIPLEKGERFKITPEEQALVKLAARGQPADGVPPFDITKEQLKWRRKKIEDFGDPRLFMQEYPSDFESCWVSFDYQVFDPNALYYQRRYLANPVRTVQVHPGPRVESDAHQLVAADHDYCAIWEEPVKGEIYDVGADVALGNEGGDWSTAVVLKRRTMEQVAEIHMHIDPRDFGTMLYWFGFFYNTAQLAPEWNSVGIPVVNELQRLSYPYLYWWRRRDGAVPILSRKVGWETSRTSKPTMVSLFRKRLNDAWHANDGTGIRLRSRVLMAELEDYVQIPWGDGFEYRADKGHDDLAMGSFIAMMALDDESFGRFDEGIERVARAPLTSAEQINEAIRQQTLVGGPIEELHPRSHFAEEMK